LDVEMIAITEMEGSKKMNEWIPPGDDPVEWVAMMNAIPTGEALHEMQRALDAAWNNPDPAIRASQRALFPGGKPSVEEFIRVMAERAGRGS